MALYIFILLHQTTTVFSVCRRKLGCISLYSYIKPQHFLVICILSPVVYLYTPTSNHNLVTPWKHARPVVYLYTPTSNHNNKPLNTYAKQLYIFILLHQTTTDREIYKNQIRCISLYSYIKPQPLSS